MTGEGTQAVQLDGQGGQGGGQGAGAGQDGLDGQQGGQGQGQDGGQQGGGSSDGGQQAAAEPTMAEISRQIQGLIKEQTRYRGFQSSVDNLPKTVDQLIQKHFKQQEQNQYLNSLPPDQRQAYDSRQQGMQQLETMIGDALKKLAPEMFKDQLGVIEKVGKQLSTQDYFRELGEHAGDMQDELLPLYKQLYTEKQRDLNSGDPDKAEAADAWLERAEKNPSFLVLQAMNLHRRMPEEQRAKLNQARQQNSTEISSQMPNRGGAPRAPGSLKGLTEAQMEKMAIENPEQWKKMLAAHNAGKSGA